MTDEGKNLCKTESEWQTMTKTVWHTNADGTKVGWNGIGGAPFFAPDWETGSLRLPDLRGMYAEAAGFDGLNVGGVHGDGMRNIIAQFTVPNSGGGEGAISAATGGTGYGSLAGNASGWPQRQHLFDPSRVAPITNKNQPRAYGVLACIYLGIPK